MLTFYIFLFIHLYTPSTHLYFMFFSHLASPYHIFSITIRITPFSPLLTPFHIPSHIFIAPWFFVKKGAQECFQWNTDFQKARKEYLSRNDSLSSTLPLSFTLTPFISLSPLPFSLPALPHSLTSSSFIPEEETYKLLQTWEGVQNNFHFFASSTVQDIITSLPLLGKEGSQVLFTSKKSVECLQPGITSPHSLLSLALLFLANSLIEQTWSSSFWFYLLILFIPSQSLPLLSLPHLC